MIGVALFFVFIFCSVMAVRSFRERARNPRPPRIVHYRVVYTGAYGIWKASTATHIQDGVGTLCGLMAGPDASHLYGPAEASCRDCRRRWQIATGQVPKGGRR
jgi:hypothetical protein